MSRADSDVRPYPSPVRKNYDYGEGFYHGSMDRYKSVKDFLNKRKKLRKKKKTIANILNQVEKFSQEVLKL